MFGKLDMGDWITMSLSGWAIDTNLVGFCGRLLFIVDLPNKVISPVELFGYVMKERVLTINNLVLL